MSQRGVAFDQGARDFDVFVGRVIQELNVEFLARVVQLADCVEQTVNNVLLIKNGQLHGDARQIVEISCRIRGLVFLVLVVKIDEPIAMRSVRCQDDQYDEVRDQQRQIESVD